MCYNGGATNTTGGALPKKKSTTFTGLKKISGGISDQPWPSLPYLYECSNGHQMGGPRPFERCINLVHGRPCEGVLTRYGPGSGKKPPPAPPKGVQPPQLAKAVGVRKVPRRSSSRGAASSR